MRTYSRQQNVSIVVDTPATIPPILANVAEIQQVITNIITNATEAAKGPVEITVGTRQQHDFVELTIRDDGPGIPPEYLTRVFDPFFSTRTGTGGTGLGLSICHSIVADHGGSIEVSSTLGHGATFVMRFPAVSADRS